MEYGATSSQLESAQDILDDAGVDVRIVGGLASGLFIVIIALVVIIIIVVLIVAASKRKGHAPANQTPPTQNGQYYSDPYGQYPGQQIPPPPPLGTPPPYQSYGPKFCTNCGREVPFGGTTCQYCGQMQN